MVSFGSSKSATFGYAVEPLDLRHTSPDHGDVDNDDGHDDDPDRDNDDDNDVDDDDGDEDHGESYFFSSASMSK